MFDVSQSLVQLCYLNMRNHCLNPSPMISESLVILAAGGQGWHKPAPLPRISQTRATARVCEGDTSHHELHAGYQPRARILISPSPSNRQNIRVLNPQDAAARAPQ